jgi:hypothetical protein
MSVQKGLKIGLAHPNDASDPMHRKASIRDPSAHRSDCDLKHFGHLRDGEKFNYASMTHADRPCTERLATNSSMASAGTNRRRPILTLLIL